ncbi:MAG: hypothetical protein PHW77_00335 [Eubacteriales bacterium]|nr:hypothetical protein [Eubacteriales bacterium]
MKNAYHWIKFVIKLIFLPLILPFFTLWAYAKYMIYRHSLTKHLKRSGIPKNEAKELSKELNPIRIFKNSAV